MLKYGILRLGLGQKFDNHLESERKAWITIIMLFLTD